MRPYKGENEKRIKDKLLSIIISVAMIATVSVPVFADDLNNQTVPKENDVIIEDAEDVADIISDSVGTSDVNDDIEKKGDNFVVEGEDVTIEIPSNGSEEVVITTDNEPQVSFDLPNKFAGEQVAITDDGTAVYASDESDALAVQGMQETVDNVVFDGVRSLISIESADAPHDYSFDYSLPEGCKLMFAKDYAFVVNIFNCFQDFSFAKAPAARLAVQPVVISAF